MQRARLSPDNIAIKIPQLPDTLHDFAPFTIDLTNGLLTLGTTGGYGSDVFFIREARVPLEMLPQRLFFDKLAGCITFHGAPAKVSAGDRGVCRQRTASRAVLL